MLQKKACYLTALPDLLSSKGEENDNYSSNRSFILFSKYATH